MSELNGIRLEMTCGACPEQYDAFLGDRLVGYLRLRHGFFYAACPNASGEVVYEAETIGDGIFASEEREMHLSKATAAIVAWHNANHLSCF
jgi:hypothetical protein